MSLWRIVAAGMDLGAIREALHREPFEPFAIRLVDGRTVPVAHPDFVALGQRRMVVVAEDDSSKTIEPFMIVSLDYGVPPSS